MNLMEQVDLRQHGLEQPVAQGETAIIGRDHRRKLCIITP